MSAPLYQVLCNDIDIAATEAEATKLEVGNADVYCQIGDEPSECEALERAKELAQGVIDRFKAIKKEICRRLDEKEGD